MPKRPNVLWIYADELRADGLSCYPDRRLPVQTPHLDALAASGVQFNNCYCNVPICTPSRASTLAALHPEQSGCYGNEGAWANFKLPKSLTTFPEVFADAGYVTANFGKKHTPREMTPFQFHDPAGGEMGDISRPMPKPCPHGQVGDIFPADIPYPANQVTDRGLAWLDQYRHDDQPWMLRLSYLQPHTPLYVPPPYDQIAADIKLDYPDESQWSLSAFEKRWSDLWRARGDFGAAELLRGRRFYCGLVAWLDHQVGRVTQWLRERHMFDDTIIVFAADHGAAKGERGTSEKHIFAPFVHRVPLIITWPTGGLPQGAVRHDLAQNIDFARTLCTPAGVTPRDEFAGRDLFNDSPPDAVFSTIGHGEADSRGAPNGRFADWFDGRGWPRRTCIRTDRWRLDMSVRIDGRPTRDDERDVFLADVAADPDEIHNLANEPEHQATAADLVERILQHGRNSVEVDQASLIR